MQNAVGRGTATEARTDEPDGGVWVRQQTQRDVSASVFKILQAEKGEVLGAALERRGTTTTAFYEAFTQAKKK